MRQFSNIAKGVIVLLPAVCIEAVAQSPAREFDIAAGDLRGAIDTYAAQAGLQLIYRVDEVKGLRGPAVKGRMAPEAALSLLLKGTPLRVLRDATGAVVVFRPATAAPAGAAPGPAPAPDGEPARVLVHGLRASLDSARDKKRAADAITDSIVADEIGKLPDQNIAEAARRIPGVQMQRYMEEGGAIAIRGLKQIKVLLNGMEVFGASAHAGEYNGRNFDLEDLPAEVLAGIDVSKSSSADEIEGGLGGRVDLRTRRPFDFGASMASLSVKATDYRMAPGFGGKIRTQASALASGRWTTGAGEMGLLVNLARTGSVFGLTENEVQRPHRVDNYAGSGKAVTVPIGMFTGGGHNGGRERDTVVGAFQWRLGATASLYANYIGVNYLMDQTFQTARFYAGAPTADYRLWGDRNGDGSDNLRAGTFINGALTGTSALSREGRRSRLYDIGGQWTGGALRVSARLGHNDTAVFNTLSEWGTRAAVPWMRLMLNDGAASRLSVAGIDLTAPANHHPAYLLAIAQDGIQTNTAVTLDANYRPRHAWVASVDVGLRVNDYTRRSFGFVRFYCIDGCDSARTLATVDPALLHVVPAARSREVGAFVTYSAAAVRQQAALRARYGLPAADARMRQQDQFNNETTAAAYVKVNYDIDFAGQPVRGNIGVRLVDTALHGEAYGIGAAGAPVPSASGSRRREALPAFNAHIGLRDDLVLRLAASRTSGQVNFSYLNPAVNIGNQVQRDAQAGNPALRPYTSTNVDLSLERYLSGHGMAYLSVFNKLAGGFIQSVAEKRMIDGEEYNVSTYQSAGRARIEGVEIGYQQFFDRLPAPFRGLGMQANYTYVDARAPSSVAGRTVPLEGLSRHSYNLIAMFARGGLKARLAYNYRSGFVVTTSSSGAQAVPVLAKSLGTLDFSIGYDLSRQLSLALDGVNIGGARGEQYYGNRHNPMNYQPLNKRYGLQARYVY